MNKQRILGWNSCISALYDNGIINIKDLVEVWKVTTPKEIREAYFKR